MNHSSPTIQFDRSFLADYETARRREWLLTNGLGGYASSTVLGVNTRSYHGLLVASHPPGLTRILLLAKVEEEAQVQGQTYALSVNRYRDALHPQGHRFLQAFALKPWPQATYELDGILLTKSVRLIFDRNATVVSYRLGTDAPPVRLKLAPLVTWRDHHLRTRAETMAPFRQEVQSGTVVIEAYSSAPKLYLRCEGARYSPTGSWYRNFFYEEEAERGFDALEDLYNPGIFDAALAFGDELRLLASDRPLTEAGFSQLPEGEKVECSQTITPATRQDAFLRQLLQAAEQFVITIPGQDAKTIIAGYHWFGEWGRDAAISLPGLLLTTRRYEEAKAVLRRFLATLRHGLVAVRFNDGTPVYDSVDTSLWFVHAVHEYLRHTKDRMFLEEAYLHVRGIVDRYARGTDYGIRMTKQGLLAARHEGVGLTWMDARVDGVPVTPRSGAPVEVNALWYNALRVVEALGNQLGEQAATYGELAERVHREFNNAFWNEETKCLYDCIDGDFRDASVRPNQVFAVTLRFPVLDAKHWPHVLDTVEKHLLTPVGLRTLAPNDPRYRGRYHGTPRARDLTYHQGTVWAWLVGPFVTAHLKTYGMPHAQILRQIWDALAGHLTEAGLGTISEVFDGDPPHVPRGCIAQAWSVAEVLRAYSESIGGWSPA